MVNSRCTCCGALVRIAEYGADQRSSVYVLDGGISPEDAVRCEAVITSSHPSVRLEWLRPDMQMFARFAESAWHSRAMYLRLLIPDLLPDDVERVLYVDSDVVVVRDLSPLWSVDFEQLAVYAVENFSHPTFATALPEAVSGIGASPETPYFNSGVLLMNLRVWREEGISEQVNAFLRDRPDLITWGDQDALNLAIAGRWGL